GDVVAHLVQYRLVADPVDLDPHPAFDDVTAFGVLGFDVDADLLQRPQRLPAHNHERVHEQVDVEVAGGQRGRHGVHEERHVVGDDLQNGVPGVVVPAGAQLQLAGQPLHGQITVGRRGGDHLLAG